MLVVQDDYELACNGMQQGETINPRYYWDILGLRDSVILRETSLKILHLLPHLLNKHF
jgi:hypothetical protein